jgi:hypothetical protein
LQCRLAALGGVQTGLDFRPLCDLALMLYGSALIAERYSGIHAFLQEEVGATTPKRTANGFVDVSGDTRLLPVTRNIINGAGATSFLANPLPTRPQLPCELFLKAVAALSRDARMHSRVALMHVWHECTLRSRW